MALWGSAAGGAATWRSSTFLQVSMVDALAHSTQACLSFQCSLLSLGPVAVLASSLGLLLFD
jgi:hypothetical protein